MTDSTQHLINNEQQNSKAEGNKVAYRAVLMSIGTLLSRILGLVRDSLFAALFPRMVTDAWSMAWRIPNMFRRLLGEGSLSVSFIPVFVKAKEQDSAEAKNLVNSVYTILLLVLSVITVLGVINSELIVSGLADAKFQSDIEKFNLTVSMTKIMFSFVFLICTYAFYMGILNALGYFTLAAIAPVLFNVSMIISNLLPQSWFSLPGEALAWGVVTGGFLQAVVLIPALVRLGFLPKFSFKNIFSEQALIVFKNMIPGLLGLGLLQFTSLINMNFASSLSEGTITYFYLADRVLELPLSLVSVSLGTALLPTLSKFLAQNKNEDFLNTIDQYMKLNFFVTLPAAVGLYFFSEGIVELLFQWGHFSQKDLLGTSEILKVYAFTMIVTSCIRVFVPAYYAKRNTWFPAFVSAMSLVLHLILAPWLMKIYQAPGLALSTFLSGLFNFILLILFSRRYIGHLNLVTWLKSLLQYIPGVLGLSFVFYTYTFLLNHLSLQDKITRSCFLVLFLGISAMIYFLFGYLSKIREAHFVVNQISSRLKRKKPRN